MLAPTYFGLYSACVGESLLVWGNHCLRGWGQGIVKGRLDESFLYLLPN